MNTSTAICEATHSASPAARTTSTETARSERHYLIGPVAVSIRSNLSWVLEGYHSLYRRHATTDAPADAIPIEVRATRSLRTGRRSFHVFARGERMGTVRSPEEVAPHIEAAINRQIAKYLPDYIQIHAAALALDGKGLLLAGPPCSGKSTLAAALLSRGWSYGSDEFALVDPETGRVVSYPRAISIKEGSIPVLRRFGVPLDDCVISHRRDHGRFVCLSPYRVRPDPVAEPFRARMVVFPYYDSTSPSAMRPVSRAQALFNLSRGTFNLVRFRAPGVALLADLVRSAACSSLRVGGLLSACRLLEDHATFLSRE